MTDEEERENKLHAEAIRSVAEASKDTLVKELVAVYELLEEAYPLALQRLYQGGVSALDQSAFWVADRDLGDYCDTFACQKPEGDWQEDEWYGTRVRKRIDELRDYLQQTKDEATNTH